MRVFLLSRTLIGLTTTFSSVFIAGTPLLLSSKGPDSHDLAHVRASVDARTIDIQTGSHLHGDFRLRPTKLSAVTFIDAAQHSHRTLEEGAHLEEHTNFRIRAPPGYPPLPGVSPPLLNIICTATYQVVSGPPISRLLNQAIRLAYEQLRLHPLGVVSEEGFQLVLNGYGISIYPREGIFLDWAQVAAAFLGIVATLAGEARYELSTWHLRK